MKWQRQYGVNDEHAFLIERIADNHHHTLVNVSSWSIVFCFPHQCHTREHQFWRTDEKLMRIKGSSNITSKYKEYHNNHSTNNEWMNERRHTRPDTIVLPNWSCMHIHKCMSTVDNNNSSSSRWTIWWCVTIDCWMNKWNFSMMMMMMTCRSVTYAINNHSVREIGESEETSAILLQDRHREKESREERYN